MRPPASTDALSVYVDGNRLFNAKSAIRFRLARITGPAASTIESIRALLVKRREDPLEVVHHPYLPRLKSQPQRARGGRENLFHLE